jgi:hypothetical protein
MWLCKRVVSCWRAIFLGSLGLFGGEGVQTSVKFVKVPSPHPQPPSMGEGGRRPGKGSVADRIALLGGLRLLATSSGVIFPSKTKSRSGLLGGCLFAAGLEGFSTASENEKPFLMLIPFPALDTFVSRWSSLRPSRLRGLIFGCDLRLRRASEVNHPWMREIH